MLRFLEQAIEFILEFILKITASLAALIALAAPGGFLSKLAEGFQSLRGAVQEVWWWITHIDEFGQVMEDYNTLTAAAFNQKYGAGAVNSVMDYLNEGVDYIQRIWQNLNAEPIGTLLAAILIFLIFYLAARLIRFVRQRGQGSFIDKFERKQGRKVFKSQTAIHKSKI